MSALGERLRAAREARGLTLSDVAEQIRIRSVYLAAIEEEHWGAIGAPVYIRGFLRTYARFLGLDPEEAVASFNASGGAATAPPLVATPSTTTPAARRSLTPLLWIASAVAVVLIAFVIYNFVSLQHGQSPDQSVAQQPGTSPTASASPPAGSESSPSPFASGAPLASTQTLAIHLTAPSWLRVTVDGNVSIEGTFSAGTTKTFHGRSALVRVGNAGGVEITVDGKPVGRLGRLGDVIERTFAL